MTHLRPSLALCVLATLAAGCTAPDGFEDGPDATLTPQAAAETEEEAPAGVTAQELRTAEEFEVALSEELADLAATFDVFIADRAEAEEAARDEATGAPTCAPTVGTCNVCATLDGGWFGGSWTVETTPTPCGWSYGDAAWSQAWSVLNSEVVGTWVPTVWFGGSYDVDVIGSRTTELVTESTLLGDSVLGTQWDLEAAAIIDALELTQVSGELAVVGFFDWAWTVDFVADATGLSGVASVDNDLFTCSISGDFAAPVVACVAN